MKRAELQQLFTVLTVMLLDPNDGVEQVPTLPVLATPAAGNVLPFPGQSAAPPVPAPGIPAPNGNQLLEAARAQADAPRIDPVVPPGTPGTVTLPATGHVLSVARPDLHEMFVGYCERVSAQAGGNAATVGALMLGTAYLFEKLGGYRADGANWPEAADRFYNLRSYFTPEEQAAEDAAKAARNQGSFFHVPGQG
jgi:hypothetical protein